MPLTRLLLQRGHEVLVLTRTSQGDDANIAYINGDLGNITSLKSPVKEFRPDVFLHLAWEGLPDYSWENCRKNLDYSMNLLTLATTCGCSCFLSTGSCWEYASKTGSLHEDASLDSTKVFPSVKNAIRWVGEAVARQYGIRFYWLRLFFVYGPRQRRTSLIPYLLETIHQGQLPIIRTPKNRQDFIFVEDAARAIADIAIRQPEQTVYNIGSGYSIGVEDIMTIIYDIMNKAAERQVLGMQQDENIQNFWADISSIQRDLGWQAHYDIKSGIRATAKHFLQI